MSVRTAWVKKPIFSKGLDPLGSQAPSINLYGQLLPGITNVTDRARYYTFYPWVIWTYDRLSREKSFDDLVRFFRRADCLFSMVGIRHRIALGDDDSNRHDSGLIGSQTLRPLISKLGPSDSIRLSDFTHVEDGIPNRYFKNRFGGLRQYYLGTFDNLGIMKRAGNAVAYTPERGAPLAKSFDLAVNQKHFVDTIDADEVSIDTLDELFEFCPCQLLKSQTEHEALLTTFFDKERIYGDEGMQRRQTLGLYLDIIRSLTISSGKKNVILDQHVFRGCVYSGALPNGHSWNYPQSLTRTREGWFVYQRNELLSLAVQFLFWVALQCMEEDQPHLSSTDDFVKWFAESRWASEVLDEYGAGDYEAVLDRVKASLPPLTEWQNPSHEMELARLALEAFSANKKSDARPALIRFSTRILLNLIARDDLSASPYEPMRFPKEYFTLYPINLESLRHHSRSTWSGIDIRVWLGWIGGYWGIDTHMHVALRKLRYQSIDTFHIIPKDQGFVVQEMPEPTYTTPRFSQALQILQDIGAIDRLPRSSEFRVTALGDDLWRMSCD